MAWFSQLEVPSQTQPLVGIFGANVTHISPLFSGSNFWGRRKGRGDRELASTCLIESNSNFVSVYARGRSSNSFCILAPTRSPKGLEAHKLTNSYHLLSLSLKSVTKMNKEYQDARTSDDKTEGEMASKLVIVAPNPQRHPVSEGRTSADSTPGSLEANQTTPENKSFRRMEAMVLYGVWPLMKRIGNVLLDVLLKVELAHGLEFLAEALGFIGANHASSSINPLSEEFPHNGTRGSMMSKLKIKDGREFIIFAIPVHLTSNVKLRQTVCLLALRKHA
ncbi:hypothetical protein CPB83DRAFT_951665 [Crepidotus variabilis]|uniref:Uncharacterized protein n=1 Tax=Crepidotus variabilis TaxID=179855 RepID=A0A9P6E667_9AGAR|nr:hypothetical protein CPB83DRAFT_951665 [Crepidotus variabilis]